MNGTPVTELTLYRYRYVISYALLVLLAVGLLILNFHTLPPGMTAGEQASALTSAGISFANFHLETFGGDMLAFLRTIHAVDLPYHLVQKASLQFFGLSPLGVRLPSLIFALSSIFMIFGLLRRWLRGNTAVVVGALIASSSWFLSVGRLGTPDIMVIFWTVLILFLATLVSQESRYYQGWKVVSLVSIGLSLYTPYTLYLFIAAAIATFTQPHLRYVVHYAGKISVTIGTLLFVLILIPLGFNLWYHPAIAWQLLAVPTTLPEPFTFFKNFGHAASAMLNPYTATYTTAPQPLLAIPTAVLALMGVIRLASDWHSVRSHVLLLWLAILVPLIGLDSSHNLVVLFVPLMLVSGIGLQVLVKYWYTIFPRNPYARVFALLPLGALVFSIIQFNYFRYFIGIPYAATTVSVYNQDPFLVTDSLASKAYRDQRLMLVVPANMVSLYSIDRSVAHDLTVVSPADFASINNANRVLIAEDTEASLNAAQLATFPTNKIELLVNDRKDNGLRFRVYSSF